MCITIFVVGKYVCALSAVYDNTEIMMKKFVS